jgi:hypothetical protein
LAHVIRTRQPPPILTGAKTVRPSPIEQIMLSSTRD